ncbi:MAG: gamma carbonic anhydrase family protein [Chloroflexi bacterium]|nr:gamma carbonic anhydrase family protein [Chloroflexota bacterium]
MILEPFDGHWPTVAPDAEVAETAVLVGKVTVAARARIGHGVVLRADIQRIRIGEGAWVQENVVMHTADDADTVVGPEAVVEAGAVLEGCMVGRGARIGARAAVLNYATVGDGARVVAGAVVAERQQVPAGATVAGAPARLLDEDPAARAGLDG